MLLSTSVTQRIPVLYQIVRGARAKPWVTKFRLIRGMQPFAKPFEMKSIVAKLTNCTPSEAREYLKREGVLPPLEITAPELTLGSTGTVIEPYVPPADDGKSSALSLSKVTEATQFLSKGKSMLALRTIKKYDATFDQKNFLEHAQRTYMEVNTLLEDFNGNLSRLLILVTETGIQDMAKGLMDKTFRWNFVESIEPPRVVRIRVTQMISEDNEFAQITVRFHTKQSSAVYDRFGRLIYGHEDVVRDILEYIVFEKFISDEYSDWRVHSKILPEWAENKTLYRPTIVLPNQQPEPVVS